MSVFGRAGGGVYHATETCAPEGHDRLLAEFALDAGMTPCGVCQPREVDSPTPEADEQDNDGPEPLFDEPVESPFKDITRDDLEAALDRAGSVPELADVLRVASTTALELLGRHGMGDAVVDARYSTDGGQS